MNTITISGNLGRDVELRYTSSGKAVANLSVAVNDNYNDKKQTYWFNVVVWGKQAESLVNLKKGSSVLVTGRLTTRNWEDKTGQKRQTVEVVASAVGQINWGETSHSEPEAEKSQEPITDDDIPF